MVKKAKFSHLEFLRKVNALEEQMKKNRQTSCEQTELHFSSIEEFLSYYRQQGFVTIDEFNDKVINDYGE